MTTVNDARRAHELLDELDARAELSQEQEKLLRSFLPELPKQKTLEEIGFRVYDAWIEASGNKWGGNSYDPDVSIEDWLGEPGYFVKIRPTPPAQYPLRARAITPTGGITFYTPEEATEWLDTPHRHMAETYIKWTKENNND